MSNYLNIWPAPLSFHIEPAKIQDAAACARLQQDAFFHPWDEDTFERFFLEQNYVCLVACDAVRRIGGVIVARHVADETEIITVIVEKKHRHKSIGRALVQALCDKLSQLGSQKLFLEVRQDNHSAVNLYLNQGFKQVGMRDKYYAQTNQSDACALVMRYDLV